MTGSVFRLDSSLGFLLGRVAGLLKRELQRAFADAGFDVTSEQWAVLCRLKNQNGALQRELAESLGKDPANLTRILDVMQRRRQITRQLDPNDRRARRIYLTPEGEKLLTALIDIPERLLGRCLEGIAPGDIATVKQVVGSIEANLRPGDIL